jgi:catechol 2,3-dioxygenase-like lactoylglutathione lyase family enzyme
VFRALGRVVLIVEDQQAACDFYTRALGFHTLFDQEVDGYRYLHVGLPDQADAGLWLMPPAGDEERALIGRQAGNQPFLVLYTDKLDDVRRALDDNGVAIWADRADATSRSLHFRDCAGNVIIAAEMTAGG